MILKLLITRGNITLIPKEATEAKEKENYITDKKENQKKENQKNIKIGNDYHKRGVAENIHDISLSIL